MKKPYSRCLISNCTDFFAAGLVAALLSLTTGQLHAETTVFSDDFSDGDRNGWYTGSAGSGLEVSDGALIASDPEAMFLVHFTRASLAVGEAVTILFDMSVASVSDADSNLRIGVFDSSGSGKVSSDRFGMYNNPVFDDYVGSRMYTNVGSSGVTKSRLNTRGTPNSNLLGSGGWSEFGSGDGLGLVAGNSYAFTIIISRTTTSSLRTDYLLDGNLILSGMQGVGPSMPSSFGVDTFAIYKNLAGDLSLDNFTVKTN